jgi:hypothetical protein
MSMPKVPVFCGDCGVAFVRGTDGVWRHPGECAEDARALERYNVGHSL